MQASLTLDSHNFDENMLKAEQRLAALEQRAANQPQETRSNVGVGAGDPAQQASQVKHMLIAQEVRASNEANLTMLGAATRNYGGQQTALTNLGQHYATTMQKMVSDTAPLHAVIDSVTSKLNALTARTAQVTGQAATVPVTAPLSTPSAASRVWLPPSGQTEEQRHAEAQAMQQMEAFRHPQWQAPVGETEAQKQARFQVYRDQRAGGAAAPSSPGYVDVGAATTAANPLNSYGAGVQMSHDVVGPALTEEQQKEKYKQAHGVENPAGIGQVFHDTILTDVAKYPNDTEEQQKQRIAQRQKDADKAREERSNAAIANNAAMAASLQRDRDNLRDNPPPLAGRELLESLKAQTFDVQGLPQDRMERAILLQQRKLDKLSGAPVAPLTPVARPTALDSGLAPAYGSGLAPTEPVPISGSTYKLPPWPTSPYPYGYGGALPMPATPVYPKPTSLPPWPMPPSLPPSLVLAPPIAPPVTPYSGPLKEGEIRFGPAGLAGSYGTLPPPPVPTVTGGMGEPGRWIPGLPRPTATRVTPSVAAAVVASGGAGTGGGGGEPSVDEEGKPAPYSPFFKLFQGSVARRGMEQSLSYQQYQIAQSPVMGSIDRLLEPIAPGFSKVLAAISGPQMLVAGSAAALGLAMKMAADAAMAYSKAQFVANETIRGSSLAPGGVNQGFLATQADRMKALGISGTEQQGLIAQIGTYTTSPAEIAKIQQESIDLARKKGLSVEQTTGMYLDLTQGNAGAFHAVNPLLNAGDTQTYVEQVMAKSNAGTAERFMATPQGTEAKMSAAWNDMMVGFGQDLLPVLQSLTEGATALVPALSGVLSALGFVVTAVTDLGKVLMLVPDALGNMIPGLDELWSNIGKGIDFAETKAGGYLSFLEDKYNPSKRTAVTGLSPAAGGGFGTASDTNTWNGQPELSHNPMSDEGGWAAIAEANPGMGGPAPVVRGPSGLPKGLGRGENIGAGAAPGTVMGFTAMTDPVAQRARDLAAAEAKYPGGMTDIQKATLRGEFSPEMKIQPPTADNPADGTGDSDKLANDTAAAKISAMRSIADEVSLTNTAIGGVQETFAKLSTFHVDFTQVEPNLKNLQDGIQYLQKFWLDVANSEVTGLHSIDKQRAETWLQMTNAMLTMMQSASGVLSDVYKYSGEMPSKAQLTSVVTKVSDVFKEVYAIGNSFFGDASTAQQITDQGVFNGLLTGLTALLTFMGSSSDVLSKIYTTPVPSPAAITAVVTQAVSLTKQISVAINDELIKGGVVDVNLGAASAQAANATALINFADAGAKLFKDMTNIHVPSDPEIKSVVTAAMSLTKRIATEINAQIHSNDAPDTLSFAGPLIIHSGGGPAAGSDPTLKSTAETADNMAKIMGFAQAGVGAIAGMRNLSVPGPGEMKRIIGGVFVALNAAIADLPPYDPAQTTAVKAQGDAYGSIMSMLSSGVNVIKGIRDLAEPTTSMLNAFKRSEIYLRDNFTVEMPLDVAERVTAAGNAYGAEYSALSTAADVLGKIFSVPMPTPHAIAGFKTAFDQSTAFITAEAVAMSQPVSDRLLDWGNGVGSAYTALSAGADWLGKIAGLFIPDNTKIDKAFAAEQYLADKATKAATDIGPSLAKDVLNYGQAMTSAFGGLSAGAKAISDIAYTPAVSDQAIDAYFVSLSSVITDYSKRMEKWVADMAMENVKYAPDVEHVMTAMTAGTDFLFKLGSLKPDYSHAIAGYFAQATQIVDAFAAEAPRWAIQLTPEANTVAISMKGVGDALSSALDPLVKMETASRTRPTTITAAFTNVKQAVTAFSDLAKDPQFQGVALTELRKFAGITGEIFGSIKTTIDAVNILNAPGPKTGSLNFGAALRSFFTTDVSTWSGLWAKGMQDMANSTNGMAHSVLKDLSGLPANGAAGTGSIAPYAPDVRAGGVDYAAAGGNTYNNCLILDGAVIGEGTDVAALIAKMTQQATIKQGGVPAGKP